MFVVCAHHQCVKNASCWNRTNFLGVLCKKVAEGSIDSFGSWRNTGQKNTVFSSKFCVIQLECVITNLKKSQKISTFYVIVRYLLFILEKTKQKGSIVPFASSRVKRECLLPFSQKKHKVSPFKGVVVAIRQ